MILTGEHCSTRAQFCSKAIVSTMNLLFGSNFPSVSFVHLSVCSSFYSDVQVAELSLYWNLPRLPVYSLRLAFGVTLPHLIWYCLSSVLDTLSHNKLTRRDRLSFKRLCGPNFFNPEAGGSMFFRNVGVDLQHCRVSESKILQSRQIEMRRPQEFQ
jgi:hypothetical protein